MLFWGVNKKGLKRWTRALGFAKIETSCKYRIKPFFMENTDTLAASIELQKNEKSKVKKFLPAVVLATSFYYSFMLAIGLVLGYIASKLYCHIFKIDEFSDRRIFIDCGKWKIHFHHWIMGAIVLVATWFIDYYYLPQFFVGVIAVVIAHDIYDYNDWHQVIVKNEELAK